MAIKLITSGNDNEFECNKTLTEIAILRQLSSIKNNVSTIKLLDVISGTWDDKTSYAFIVMEHFETDLAKLLHNSRSMELTEKHVITIFYNILCALNVVHTSNVIHRDIKPANILVDENCHVRICDFGLSRTMPEHIQLPCKENIARLS